VVEGCRSCELGEAPDKPLRERVLVTDSWRVAHAFDTSLPGWLVVVPHEHVESLSDLSDEAAAELGPLLQRLSRALESVVGCTKAYVLFLAEADGFPHVHLHVVPRMPDQPAEERGPRIFSRLGVPDHEVVPEEERDVLAVRITEVVGDFIGNG
jgi:diadenosine tetraphosphate (Ap4A) HIT family hydrolase